jgi:hypothetical protein
LIEHFALRDSPAVHAAERVGNEAAIATDFMRSAAATPARRTARNGNACSVKPRTVARCTSDAAEHLWMIHTAAIYNEHRPQRAPPTTSTAHNEHRPQRALGQAAPLRPVPEPATTDPRRPTTRAARGLIREYQHCRMRCAEFLAPAAYDGSASVGLRALPRSIASAVPAGALG